MSLNITEAAANKVLQLITEEANPQLALRVYIVGGGCSGFQYGFAFDAARNDDDTIIEKSAIKVLVDALSLQYLIGATIDYVENLQGAHFVVQNPNANTTCGCGSSFSV
ncbi:MAG TPA: iron-sulfur cluster insertion protein ErpA [Gammaproteobacteria bacterium]|nr:iron-sulfur cluster insertion protein ErpA [Gammaproteobacteria bacterium]